LEDILGLVYRGILHVLYFIVRMLVVFMYELGIDIIGWYIGWPIVRIATFNQYPKEAVNENKKASKIAQFFVITTGFVVLVASGAILAHALGAFG